MNNNQSSGSKLGAISGAVITVAFFMPWVQACGQQISGYDLASDTSGQIENAAVYWLPLVAGLLCVALYFLLRTNTGGARLGAAVIRLLAGIVGFFPVLNIWNNVRELRDAVEVLPGGWIIAVGYAGVFLSFLVDLFGGSDE